MRSIPLAAACAALLSSTGMAKADSAPETAARQEAAQLLLASADDEVMVIVDNEADPARIAGAAQVVDERKLETYEYDDVHQVLRLVPGVYMLSEDGFGLRPNIGMRGASADRSAKVTLMEDGVLLAPAPYAAPAAYYFPLVTTMRAVEVYKGSAAIRFGPQTVGGAVNMLTPRLPRAPMGYVDLAAGTFGYLKAHARAGAGSERYGALMEAVHLQSTGFKELDGGGNTGFDKDEVRLKLEFGSDPGNPGVHRLGIKLGYADEVSHETYVGLTEADFLESPYRRYAATQDDLMTWWRTQGELHHVYTRDNLVVETTAYRHDFERSWSKLAGFGSGVDLAQLLSGPDAGQAAVYLAILRGEADSTSAGEALVLGTNHRTYVSQGVQSALVRHFGSAQVSQVAQLGVRLHMDHIDRDHTTDTRWMVSGDLQPTGDPTRQATLNRGAARAIAAYGQDEISFGRWLFTPGVRAELIWTSFVDKLDADGAMVDAPTSVDRFDAVLLPGGGALYSPRPWLSVLAGVHRGFSAVSPGQPDEIVPEWSLNYEAGVRLGALDRRAELIGFFNDYQNLTSECTYSSGCQDQSLGAQYNGGEVNVYGIEASAQASQRFKRGPEWAVAGSYTLTQSSFRNAFVSQSPTLGEVEVGDALPYVPVHQGSLELGAIGPRWQVSLNSAATAAMRDTAGQGPIPEGGGTDAFVVFDLSASHAVGERGALYLKADNLTDAVWLASRRPEGARPGKPQQLQVGLKANF